MADAADAAMKAAIIAEKQTAGLEVDVAGVSTGEQEGWEKKPVGSLSGVFTLYNHVIGWVKDQIWNLRGRVQLLETTAKGAVDPRVVGKAVEDYMTVVYTGLTAEFTTLKTSLPQPKPPRA